MMIREAGMQMIVVPVLIIIQLSCLSGLSTTLRTETRPLGIVKGDMVTPQSEEVQVANHHYNYWHDRGLSWILVLAKGLKGPVLDCEVYSERTSDFQVELRVHIALIYSESTNH
ncbi:uncharacterized protein EDB93DRAFT_1137763 [Suillus bovinus]|uniref:uncharacterized protein n=1 Tax=Suillus bovinus TaxID=48563 RepID=UPI001B8623E3|nr:uncharacterized protein EDB93DRAFT_1137763 [Suillus bovinus]KAG2152649.1 hypothetical protein EDB93DRAFT_1137763 [Suillus bovinus]